MAFVKHGGNEGKITSVIKTDDLTDEQKKLAEEASKIIQLEKTEKLDNQNLGNN